MGRGQAGRSGPYTDILAPDGKTGWDKSPGGVAVEVRGRGAPQKVVLL